MLENTLDSDIIVHSLPYNPEVCGGIKVHYQLAMLEQQLGYDVFMIYNHPDIPKVQWFDHSCKEMTLSVFKDYLISSGRKVFLLIGYEEPVSLKIVDAKHKVAYIQGHVYYQEGKYEDISLWFNGNYCKELCKVEGEVVLPYLSRVFTHTQIDDRELYDMKPLNIIDSKYGNAWGTKNYLSDTWPFLRDEENKKEKYKLLIQERKQGEEAWQEISKLLPKVVLDKLDVTVHKNSNEKEFAKALYDSDIFIAHSHPEGFNLPPLEAMSLGTVVIGYTGGGGSDFMESSKNCLMADDGDVKGIVDHITNFVLNFSSKNIFDLKLNGKCTAISYNAFSTFKILHNILKSYHKDIPVTMLKGSSVEEVNNLYDN